MISQSKNERISLPNGDDAVLILEGGAMRGMFTAGVLDAFMEKDFYFRHTIGISAGVLQGLCYVSHQRGRNIKVNVNYAGDVRYMGIQNMLRKGSYFNFDFMFGELAHKLEPFDYMTFENAEEEISVIVTDAGSARPIFISNKEVETGLFMKLCMASCSIPLVSKPVDINGHFYFDGGVGMPLVPLPEELPESYRKIVYVLTRAKSYRKKPVSKIFRLWMNKVYGKRFPKIAEAMCSIPERYNERLERLEKLEREGKVFVIRPAKKVTVSRIEKNVRKLRGLHREGYYEVQDCFDDMMRWFHGK